MRGRQPKELETVGPGLTRLVWAACSLAVYLDLDDPMVQMATKEEPVDLSMLPRR